MEAKNLGTCRGDSEYKRWNRKYQALKLMREVTDTSVKENVKVERIHAQNFPKTWDDMKRQT